MSVIAWVIGGLGIGYAIGVVTGVNAERRRKRQRWAIIDTGTARQRADVRAWEWARRN